MVWGKCPMTPTTVIIASIIVMVVGIGLLAFLSMSQSGRFGKRKR